MSIWDDIGGAISSVGDAVAGVVEDVGNTLEEVFTDVVETVGNGISDALGGLGDLLGNIPLVGGALSAVFHWLGDVVSSITDLWGALIKGVFGIWSGVTAGWLRVVFGGIGGLIAWDADTFVKGLGDILAGIGGAVLLVGGKIIGVVQSIIPLQWGKRRLTRNERAILRRVFRGSVALYNVRIIEGFAGIYSINDRPFTLGNTIYMKDVDPASEPWILVHECVHVWQYQNMGGRYVADALGAQALVDDAYSWEAELTRGNARWQDFNEEAQGKFLEDVYREGRFVGSAATGNGEFYNDDPVGSNVEFVFGGTDRTVLARDSVAYVRDARAARLSALF